MHIHVIDHPLIQHKLTIMRKKETSSGEFRRLLQEITLLMGYELTRDLPLEDVAIETPLEKATGKQVAGKKLGIVPILRAGFGMVEGLTELMPSARIGVIGLYRDPVTAKPIEYYCKLPDVENRDFILVDPMLATGGSAVAAIDMMKRKRRQEYQIHVSRRCPGRCRGREPGASGRSDLYRLPRPSAE